MTRPLTYVYAGFTYAIEFDSTGRPTDMRPVPGQHEAAWKDKHRRNALDMYLADKGGFAEVRDAVARARKARMDTPPVADPPRKLDTSPASHTKRAERVTRYMRNAPVPAPDVTFTTWQTPGSLFAKRSKRKLHPELATAQVGDDSGVPCPTCEASMTVTAFVHDEVQLICNACGWPGDKRTSTAKVKP